MSRLPTDNTYHSEIQRSPSQFTISSIRTERELTRDPTYVPAYGRWPIGTMDVEVEFDSATWRG